MMSDDTPEYDADGNLIMYRTPEILEPDPTKLNSRYVSRLMKVNGMANPIPVLIRPQVPGIPSMTHPPDRTLAASGTFGQTTNLYTGTITTQQLKEMYPNYFVIRPIPSQNIREMVDPYNNYTRKMFTDCARTDPTLQPALAKRNHAFFANGFVLKLEVKSKYSPIDGHVLEKEEQEEMASQYYSQYLGYLTALETWCNSRDIRLETKLRASHYVGTVQGRFLAKVYPPLSILQPGKLPEMIKVVSAEEMGNVIIDRMTEEIVAIRIYSVDEENFTLLPDEFVYGFVNDSALTRYERFYGRSDLESIVQLSRINKHTVNIAYAKALENAYLPKILLELEVDGSPEEKESQLTDYVKRIMASGTDIVAVEASENSKAQAIPQEVRHEMITAIRKDLDEIVLGVAGSTKAQISRTENLTRDNATIMEIENRRNVVMPDENTYAEFYETQLLNPLLSHLMGIPEDQIPVKIYIERIPDETDVLEQLDEKKADEDKKGDNPFEDAEGPEGGQMNLQQQKEMDISAGQYMQDDRISSYGAAGDFDESKVNRDSDGKFATKPGSKKSAPEKKSSTRKTKPAKTRGVTSGMSDAPAKYDNTGKWSGKIVRVVDGELTSVDDKYGFDLESGTAVEISSDASEKKIPKIAREWNKMPLELRRRVRILTVSNNEARLGGWNELTRNLEISTRDSRFKLDHVIRHEFGHILYGSLSVDKLEKLAGSFGEMPPVSRYVKDATTEKAQAAFRENAVTVYDIFRNMADDADTSDKDMWDAMYSMHTIILKANGIDYNNIKTEGMAYAERYKTAIEHFYTNEQFAEFIAKKYLGKSPPGFNDSVYSQMDREFKKIMGKSPHLTNSGEES